MGFTKEVAPGQCSGKSFWTTFTWAKKTNGFSDQSFSMWKIRLHEDLALEASREPRHCGVAEWEFQVLSYRLEKESGGSSVGLVVSRPGACGPRSVTLLIGAALKDGGCW